MTNRIGLWLLTLFVSGCDNSAVSKTGCDNSLTLPAGFCATVFADELGAVRHLVVASNGDIYAARWRNNKKPGGLLELRDIDHDGHADSVITIENNGGSGIAIHGSFVFMSTWTAVLRYRIDGNRVPVGPPDSIVIGLPQSGHAARSLAIDSAGNLFVAIGAPSNSCQYVDREPLSMGRDPCPERDTFAGVWRFDSHRLNQRQSDGVRIVSGLRHAVAFTIDSRSQEIFAAQHGRDDLHENFPSIYDEKRGQRLPAEALYRIEIAADYGWPYCYYDDSLARNVLAPEYHGDGNKTERCEAVKEPLVTFPAHWAPNGLLVYNGKNFPQRYRNGVFVAFHGGWFRPPPDNGFNVVFVPTASGKLSRSYEIFADGFAGRNKTPGNATHRPVGLAEGPDGALYVSDDVRGRIWRITFTQPSSTH